MNDEKHRFGIISCVLGVLASLGMASGSLADCQSGKPASYDDVNFVMFQRNACGELNPVPRPVTELRCSIYWVSFWTYDETTYSQYTLEGARGTYTLDATLNDARARLRRNNFYVLNPGEDQVTDIRESVLTVRRCGVLTRVFTQPRSGADPATSALFAAFDALVAASRKTKLSDTPEQFRYTGLLEAL